MSFTVKYLGKTYYVYAEYDTCVYYQDEDRGPSVSQPDAATLMFQASTNFEDTAADFTEKTAPDALSILVWEHICRKHCEMRQEAS